MGVYLNVLINHGIGFDKDHLRLLSSQLCDAVQFAFKQFPDNDFELLPIESYSIDFSNDFYDGKYWIGGKASHWAAGRINDDLEDWPNGAVFSLGGCGNFEINCNLQMLELATPIKWGEFLSNSKVQRVMRIICHHLASNFADKRAIYLPDGEFEVSNATDMLFEDVGIKPVEEWLIANHGLPSTSIKDIYKESADGSWNGEGYFIDNFVDLHV